MSKDFVEGRCVDVGDDETGQPRLVIHSTREEVLEAMQTLRKLRLTLIRLEAAASVYCADQSGARDERVGLVQPITVAQGKELNAALVQASEALDSDK